MWKLSKTVLGKCQRQPKNINCYQCDKIGRFLKVFGDNFSYKSSPNTWCILGFSQNTIFELKTTVASFWATFGRNYATFYDKIWSHGLLLVSMDGTYDHVRSNICSKKEMKNSLTQWSSGAGLIKEHCRLFSWPRIVQKIRFIQLNYVPQVVFTKWVSGCFVLVKNEILE